MASLFQYSIGDARAGRIEVLTATTLADDFQYSIGDAYSGSSDSTSFMYSAFNTPLEMPIVYHSSTFFAGVLLPFQYSIGDAGKTTAALHLVVYDLLSILHWRCPGTLQRSRRLVHRQPFNTPLEMQSAASSARTQTIRISFNTPLEMLWVARAPRAP